MWHLITCHCLWFTTSLRFGNHLSQTVSAHALSGEGNGTPLQSSCLENPMDRGAWWAAVHGVAKSRTRLNDFTFTFHFHALEKEMATHSSVLAWRIPGMGEPGGLHWVGHDWSDLAAAAACFIACIWQDMWHTSLALNGTWSELIDWVALGHCGEWPPTSWLCQLAITDLRSWCQHLSSSEACHQMRSLDPRENK